jgi:hypothetical protein
MVNMQFTIMIKCWAVPASVALEVRGTQDLISQSQRNPSFILRPAFGPRGGIRNWNSNILFLIKLLMAIAVREIDERLQGLAPATEAIKICILAY